MSHEKELCYTSVDAGAGKMYQFKFRGGSGVREAFDFCFCRRVETKLHFQGRRTSEHSLPLRSVLRHQ